MAAKRLRTSKKHTKFGRELLAACKEALAHSRGEIALPTRVFDPKTGRMGPERMMYARRKRARAKAN